MKKIPVTSSSRAALILAAALVSTGSVFAAVESPRERHFRSPFLHKGGTPAAEPAEVAPAQAPAQAPTRPAAVTPPANNALAGHDSLFPPQGKPGECWTRVLVSPPVETVQERVLTRQESFELIEIPAVLETVEEQMTVRAASTRQEVVPATYKEIEERVVKTPAYSRQVPVPAVYDTVSERVLVKPARSYWKKGAGPYQKIDGETGEIMCYVTEPAVYETVKRTVIKSPATVREEKVPAVYETVKRTVIDQPAKVNTIEVPAEYKKVSVQKVKTPGRVERRVIPAEYGNVSRQVARGQSHMEWRRILCSTNVTPDVIAELQTALNTAGFNVGKVDGVYGPTTVRAVSSYQASKGLPQGDLTYETLESLGIKLGSL